MSCSLCCVTGPGSVRTHAQLRQTGWWRPWWFLAFLTKAHPRQSEHPRPVQPQGRRHGRGQSPGRQKDSHPRDTLSRKIPEKWREGRYDEISPDKCKTNFDAVAVLRGEMWVFKDNYFWRINKDGGSREDPMELRSFWYGLPSDVDHIDAVYERNDHDIVFFAGKRYYVLASNSYLKYGPLPITRLGLPENLDRIDGAVRWGYNDKTYFFSGTQTRKVKN